MDRLSTIPQEEDTVEGLIEFNETIKLRRDPTELPSLPLGFPRPFWRSSGRETGYWLKKRQLKPK
jgi:hypothetical protein